MKPVKNFKTAALVIALVGLVSVIPAVGVEQNFRAQRNSSVSRRSKIKRRRIFPASGT